MGGTNSIEIHTNVTFESTGYQFSNQFIQSLERLINTKRNILLKECKIACGSDHIFFLNVILDLHEIFLKFEDLQLSRQGGTLRSQTIYDYLFTVNKIKLDLENFPKQFSQNKLFKQLYQFCAPINLNQFIDLLDLVEIKAFISKESNQQIKEYQFNSRFINPREDNLHSNFNEPLIQLGFQQTIESSRFDTDSQCISTLSTQFE